MLVVPAEGTKALMEFLATGVQLSPYVGLFANDYTPTQADTLASFTEATFVGYSRKAMGPPTGVVALPDHSTRLTWPNVVWFAGSMLPPQTVYGVFVVQLDASLVTRVLWAERMTPPVTMVIPTAVLQFTPRFDFSSLFG
jgi:hypothetical protein